MAQTWPSVKRRWWLGMTQGGVLRPPRGMASDGAFATSGDAVHRIGWS